MDNSLQYQDDNTMYVLQESVVLCKRIEYHSYEDFCGLHFEVLLM